VTTTLDQPEPPTSAPTRESVAAANRLAMPQCGEFIALMTERFGACHVGYVSEAGMERGRSGRDSPSER
jgi:hypothetical protein